jgi:hypothetical protein
VPIFSAVPPAAAPSSQSDPVVLISPPLIATQEKEFDEITGTIGEVLSEAWQRMLQ